MQRLPDEGRIHAASPSVKTEPSIERELSDY